MNLEHMSAAVRPRSQWEAIDLGLRMARAHYRSMLLCTLAITLPPHALRSCLLRSA